MAIAKPRTAAHGAASPPVVACQTLPQHVLLQLPWLSKVLLLHLVPLP